jgi:DNA repair protein RecN (Recombination protein N)
LSKYKSDSIQNLIDIKIDLDNKLQKYSIGDFELGKLLKELEEKETRVNELANNLSDKRKESFADFESRVLTLLQNLGMKNVKFSVQHEITDPHDNGIDRIQFLFSANKNVSEENISKVASGGELSRLMLAIKSLISDSFGLPTIIFDEIDSGVSGDIADKVGNLIKQMAANMQVVNITHLPQVASKGDHHYLVYKEADETRSITSIKKLDDDERLNEIAKMLSGDSVSPAAIENAKVLLRQQS